MPSARTSPRDVARRAGVSPSTVSNVLNGHLDRMRADTSECVQRAMRELGYTPNQIARQLRTGQASTIGLIVPSVANSFWGLLTRGVEQAAIERDCHVLLCKSERDNFRPLDRCGYSNHVVPGYWCTRATVSSSSTPIPGRSGRAIEPFWMMSSLSVVIVVQ